MTVVCCEGARIVRFTTRFCLAPQFLAAEQQDRRGPVHDDLQRRDLARLAHFGDLCPSTRERLVERQVVRVTLRETEQRHD